MEVFVKKLNPNAKIPTFAHEDDACADLYSDSNFIINPNEIILVSTGIALQINNGWEAQIRPRSGLSYKHGLLILNSPGTIDSGYRGEIKIIIKNTMNKPYEITKGSRIAQIAIRPVPKITFLEKDVLDDTKRGDGGFGSTGI